MTYSDDSMSSHLVTLMGKMDVGAIWLGLLIFLSTTRVETETVKHVQGSGKELGKLFSGDIWKYLSTLDQSTSRRFEQVEGRLTRKMDERIQLVNQTASIAHLERLLHHINEELSINREQAERGENQLEQFRRRTEEQQTEIEYLKRTLAELQRTVNSLLATSSNKGDEEEEEEAQNMTESTTQSTVTSLPVGQYHTFV